MTETTIKLKDAVSQATDRYRQANNDFAVAYRRFEATHRAEDKREVLKKKLIVDQATTDLQRARGEINVNVSKKMAQS